MEILIKKVNEQATLPVYEREAGSGIDLCAVQETVVEPGARVLVPTGVAVAFPIGYVGYITNQYDLVTSKSIRVTTSTIDSGYRHEIFIEVTNVGPEVHTFAVGEKVAQILVQKVERAQLIEAEDLGE